MNEIELGDKVRDVITGYEGIVVAKTEFINGCVQFGVAHRLKKNEKPDQVGEPSIDAKSLEIVKKHAVRLFEEQEKLYSLNDIYAGHVPKWSHHKKKKNKLRKLSGGPTTITKRMRGY